jgi:hypothetical protein
MFKPRLTAEPAYIDEYDQPCYDLNQIKGLFEAQDSHLLQRAMADGYISNVATTLHWWVSHQISLAAEAGKIDVLEIGGGTGSFFDCIKNDVRTFIRPDHSR